MNSSNGKYITHCSISVSHVPRSLFHYATRIFLIGIENPFKNKAEKTNLKGVSNKFAESKPAEKYCVCYFSEFTLPINVSKIKLRGEILGKLEYSSIAACDLENVYSAK